MGVTRASHSQIHQLKAEESIFKIAVWSFATENDHGRGRRCGRKMYRDALSNCGFTVIAFEDGLSALQHIEIELPDAVVLDLLLPRVGGLDVYQELRANPTTRDLPVVIVTGQSSRELEASGCRYFVRKPVSPFDLAELVEQAITERN